MFEFTSGRFSCKLSADRIFKISQIISQRLSAGLFPPVSFGFEAEEPDDDDDDDDDDVPALTNWINVCLWLRGGSTSLVEQNVMNYFSSCVFSGFVCVGEI